MGNKQPFDLTVKKPNAFWNITERILSSFQLLSVGGNITKVNCEGLKPPYLVLSNHGSMIDFPILLKATFPHPVNWVVALDGFVGRQGVSKNIGMICKRKFTNEISTARNILKILTQKKGIVTIYPEARWSICGVPERLDKALGKLVKAAKCPVVVLIEYGNFLLDPQWDVAHKRKVPVSAVFTQVVTRQEAETLPAEEIQARIEKMFSYDQYEWQYKNRIEIKSKYRANNLHKVLYRCPHCNTEFKMNSAFSELWCEECGSRWKMDVYGRLHCTNGEDTFNHVPDWYRWERQTVREEVRSGNYSFKDVARLELIKSAREGWVPLGNVTFTQGYDGMSITGTLDSGETIQFSRDTSENYSCHVEYDFKGRGDCVEFCAPKDTYYVYPLNSPNCATKLHLAAEELHDFVKQQRESNK